MSKNAVKLFKNIVKSVESFAEALAEAVKSVKSVEFIENAVKSVKLFV